MALAFVCTVAKAQTDTIKVDKHADTIRIGNIIIIKKGNKIEEPKKSDTIVVVKTPKKLSNVSTNWLVVDVGFANYDDATNYGATGGYLYNRPGAATLGKSDFKLNAGKSVNVNIWFFIQRLNLIKHFVNLKYGLGLELNNYRYKSGTNIKYLQQNPYLSSNQTPMPVIIRDSIQFTKNKLAADYVTVPFMLNFTTTPRNKYKGLSASIGVSAGYLYGQRNKQVSAERGSQKNGGDYDLERFKFSYIAEVGLGPILLYGSYSPKSFYTNGLNMKPYNLGIRLSSW